MDYFFADNSNSDFSVGEISFSEDAWCEHCGKLEPYSAVIGDECTQWCTVCQDANYGLPKELLEEIEEKEVAAKILYYAKKLKESQKKQKETENES